MSTPTPTGIAVGRWRGLLLAALVVLLGLLLPASNASAEPAPAAGTRVGVFLPAAPDVVGVAAHIAAGQRPVRGPSQPQIVSGNCVAAEAAGQGWQGPRIAVNRHGQPTNGLYTLDSPGMAPHLTGSGSSGKSQFLFRVDADKAVLDAAAFADANKMWVGNQARVFVENGPVGVLGRWGELTNWMKVTRSNTGFVHGWPSGG